MVVYERVNDRFEVETLTEGGFEIPCLETSLSLDQIYAGVSFEEVSGE